MNNIFSQSLNHFLIPSNIFFDFSLHGSALEVKDSKNFYSLWTSLVHNITSFSILNLSFLFIFWDSFISFATIFAFLNFFLFRKTIVFIIFFLYLTKSYFVILVIFSWWIFRHFYIYISLNRILGGENSHLDLEKHFEEQKKEK